MTPAKDDEKAPIDADGDRLPDGEWVEEQRRNASAMGVGVQFGGTIVLFAMLGLWADKSFGTTPWLLILGVFVGFSGGTISLLKKFK